MNESCIYQIRSYSVFGEIVKVGEKLAFVDNSWREENEVERFMYLVNKKYRVIFNERKIVHSSESHLNHSIGLQFHFFVKFTSYVLVL